MLLLSQKSSVCNGPAARHWQPAATQQTLLQAEQSTAERLWRSTHTHIYLHIYMYYICTHIYMSIHTCI